jgi:hypothetical protein
MGPVRCDPMSELGQKRSRRPRSATSGLLRTTDIVRPPLHVSNVSIPEVADSITLPEWMLRSKMSDLAHTNDARIEVPQQNRLHQ